MRAYTIFLLLNVSNIAIADSGSKVYESCAQCHGVNGETVYAGKVPAIAGRSKEELEKLLKEYKEAKRNAYSMGSVMQAQVNLHLSDEAVLKATAEYIESLK